MEISRVRIIRRVMEISFRKPVHMAFSVLLAVISALAYFVPYVAIYKLIGILIHDGGSVGHRNIVIVGVTAFAGAAVNVLTYFASLMLSHIAAFDTAYDLRLAFADKLSRLPLGFHISTGTGRQFAVMSSGIDQIQSFVAHKLPDLISSVVYPAALIVLIVTVDYRFGLPMLAGILVAYVFHYLAMGRGGAKHMMDLYYGALDEMENAAVECTRGITVIKTFGGEVSAYKKFGESVDAYTDMVIPYTRNWEKHMCWFVMLMGNAYLFMMPVALYSLRHTTDLVGFAVTLVFYLILAPSVASIIPKIGRVMEEFMRVYEETERMDRTLNEKELPVKGSEDCGKTSSNEIWFSEVSFSYEEEGGRRAVSDISFTVPEGQITAIVGLSGSGKSTISSLLARFWDVERGSITIGGTDIREIPFDVLMERMSFVLQNEYIFTQSVRDNICAGRPAATEEEIIQAARNANCHEFIMRLPGGYDTVLNESGAILSAGQKQRIALARAFLKDAPIIILDEATASQDAENEAMIQEAIARLVRGKTVIIIAHRLSSVVNADQILVMKDGAIAERGTHEELLQAGGIYTGLWNAYKRTLSWHLKDGEAAR